MLTWKLARVSSVIRFTVNRCIMTLMFAFGSLREFAYTQLSHIGSLGDEAGEGVISTAIVVMIMAFLAVGLWVAFKLIMSNATSSISTQVAKIGQ
ncbi:hypothetical protein [Ferrimicrobium acidiphilum]|uniref:hypothetical protein n=1 Tax=Ferrimicrobium acidiphilum TaxID=121039 RepID=UPI0023F004B7|nr:hypothetical protein [Ferrimicrobium acidiphilum]